MSCKYREEGDKTENTLGKIWEIFGFLELFQVIDRKRPIQFLKMLICKIVQVQKNQTKESSELSNAYVSMYSLHNNELWYNKSF